MRRPPSHLLTLALGVAVVIALFASAPSARLYAPEDGVSTPLHENTWAMKGQGREGSERTLLMIQDLLDRTASVTLSIKVRDFESAARELKKYQEQVEEMGRLVVSLDLSESSVEEFRRLSRENLADLSGLLEGSERFSELERLEITYREQGATSSAVYSLTYEGEAIRYELKRLYGDYLQRRGDIINASDTFALGTEKYEQSVSDFAEIVEHFSQVQERRTVTLPPPDPTPRCTLMLAVNPEKAVYMESLSFTGRLSDGCNADGAAILFVDSTERIRTTPNPGGSVSFLLPVERIRIGTHIAHMEFDRVYSPTLLFRVEGVTARINFSAVEIRHGIASCHGTLSARDRPVAGAMIRILDYGTEIRQIATDKNGAFETELPLSEGMHRLKAVFDESAFPIFPVESGAILLVIHPVPEGRETGIPAIAVYFAVPGLFLIAAFFYFRGSKGPSLNDAGPSSNPVEELDAATHPTEEVPRVKDQKAEASETEGAIQEAEDRYRSLLAEGRVNEAVHLLYRELAGRVAASENIPHVEAFTPRELLYLASDRAYTQDLRLFLGIHESVRYAGSNISSVEAESLLLLYRAIIGGLGHGSE
ncbi:MAG: hypothetical protein QHG99_02390 [Methanomicrobiales archaeon]|nr:hypothetical protein [Methanomicrobiales archaeon]